MKSKILLLSVIVLLIGLGGYFANKSIANTSSVDASDVVIKGEFGYDDTSAWCQGSTGTCALIKVIAGEIWIIPEFAPGEYDSKLSSFVITEEQLSTLQSGGSIALPDEVLD